MLVLCLTVFFGRIIDVSLGTIRTLLTVKGKRIIAATIGFIEATIWFLVVKEALNTGANSLWIVFSYAGGYAIGTYLGGFISNKIIKSNFCVQVIISQKNKKLVNALREEGYGVSVVDAKGHKSTKYMLFIEINHKSFKHLKELIMEMEPNAFIFVNETKHIENGFIK